MDDVSVKMGVTGLSQFKQGMSQAQASIKSTDAALKLNEKQLKATGDAETYMQQKTTLLNQKLQAQKSQIANASGALQKMKEQGVDPLSKAYQDMQTRMLEAQSAMLDTEQELQNVGTASTTAAGKTDQLTSSLQGISKKMSLDQVISGISGIASGMEKAAKKAIELGKSIWDNIVDSAGYADDVATLASRLGLSTTEVQQMQYIAGDFEASAEDIGKAWKRVRMSMASDSEEVVAMFKELGVATKTGMTELGGYVTRNKDVKDVFWEIGEALMRMPDEIKREEYATKLLGKSWDELIPLFTAGRDAYEEAMEAAPAASEDAVNQAAELADRLGKLEQAWESLKVEVIGGISPALEKAATALEGVINTVTDYLQSDAGQEQLGRINEALSGIFDDLANFDPEKVIEGVGKVLGGISDALQYVGDHWDEVKTGIEMIAGAWVGTNAVIAGLNIWKLLQGIMGVGMGSVGTAGAATGTAWGSAFGAAVLKAVPWLAGLYVALKPGNTAGDAEDDTAARKQKNYMEVLDTFDMSTIESLMEYDQYFQALMEQEYETPEHLFRAIEDFYELKRVEGGNGIIDALGGEQYATTTEEVNKMLEAIGQTDVKDFEDNIEALRMWFDILKNAGPGATVELGGQQVSVEELWAKSTEEILAQYMKSGLASRIVEQMLERGHERGFSEADYDEMIKNMMRHRPELHAPTEADDGFKVGISAEPELEEGWHSELQEEVSKNPLVATVAVQMRGFWGGGAGAGGSHNTMMQEHANGLPYVPFDGYMAMLHKGERVVTARENANYGRTYSSNLYVESMIMQNGTDAAGLAEAMAAAQRRTSNGYGS